VIEAQYTWRPLGAILVDRGVLSEDQLRGALKEQRRSGRLLGQILVEAGILSAFSLTRALSEQHGVNLESVDDEPAAEKTPAAESKPTSWRPLGKVLVENGFLTKIQLEQALAEQSRSGGQRLLGEILVATGALSAYSLARALGEQNGVALGEHDDLEAVLMSSTTDQPTYEVCEVGLEGDEQPRDVLYRSASFLEAIDFATEFIEDHDPVGLEIHRAETNARETVWTYSESRAAELAASRKTISDTFGFDPMQWHDTRPEPPKDAVRWVPPRRSA
jgi:hypothetical protein